MNSTHWINSDPTVKDFIVMAKEYYDGTFNFTKSGVKSYTAKLDPKKLKLDSSCQEAYFDIKGKNKTASFFLRMIENGSEININIKKFFA